MPRPSEYPVWIPDNTTNIVEPSSGQKNTGWIPGQAPPAQYFNWLLNLIDQWVEYLDGVTNISYVSVTTTYSVAAGVGSVFASATGGAFTVTLPSAVSNAGRTIEVKNTSIGSSNNVSIAATAGNIEGGSSDTLTQGDYRRYKSDGTNWWVMNS